MNKAEKIKSIIDSGEDFLITTHIDPDGDAVGSVLSLYLALQSMNKRPLVYLKDNVPYRYEFLPGSGDVLHSIPENRYDALFVLDCGSFFRVGEGYESFKEQKTIVNIDHHNTNEEFGTINITNDKASSTAEILYGLYKNLDIALSSDIALNIYTAIVTDTGSFRYENTNPEAFSICEEMVRLGVNPSFVAQMVYENHPKERFLLLGLVLSTLKTYNEDKIAIAHVTEEMFKKTNSSREHTDGFAEYIREIHGIDAAILIREINSGRHKISMRSKGTMDVARICNIFGGGGHRNAAGCTIDGNLEETEKKLKEVLKIS